MLRKLTLTLEPGGDRVEGVLAGNAVAAAREPERDRERLVEEVADADRLPARRRSRMRACAARPRGTGCGSSRSRPGRRWRRRRWRRARRARRTRPAAGPRRPAEPEDPCVVVADQVEEGDDDQRRRTRARRTSSSGRPGAAQRPGSRARAASATGSSSGASRSPAPGRSSLVAPGHHPPARSRSSGGRPSSGAGVGAAHRALARTQPPPDRRERAGSPPSAQTSAAGSTSITPASATVRSTTVTRPKSRSIVIPLRREDAEAGDRGQPGGEHRRPGPRVGEAQRLADGRARLALLVVAGREDDAELGGDGDHERPERRRHRVERDVDRLEHERRPAGRQRDRQQRDERPRGRAVDRSRTRPTASRPATSASSASRRARRWRPRSSTGQADDLGADPGGRIELGADLVDQRLLLVERHDRDQERDAGDVARPRCAERIAWEK